MSFKFLILVTLAIAPASALFFGCGGCSSCCAPPPPCPPQPPPCECNQGGYAQTPACNPRYIIVQPTEQNAGAAYASAGPVPVPQPIYNAPEPSYNAPPVPQPASYATSSVSVFAAARASKTLISDENCNSKELKLILEEAMVAGDPNESKRRTYSTSNEQFQTKKTQKNINVICAPSKISYRIATDLFCEHTKDDITCFAYQQI